MANDGRESGWNRRGIIKTTGAVLAGSVLGATGTAAASSETPGITSGETYKLLNVESGAALDVAGSSVQNGGDAQVWEYVGGANQQWRIEATGDGYYKLVNENSGKVLDVSGVSTDDGANVHQWDDVGGDNQQWQIEQTSTGIYKLTARHSGKVLEADGLSATNGTTAQQWGDGGGATQRWAVFPVGADTEPAVTLTDGQTDYDGYFNTGTLQFTVRNDTSEPVALNPTVLGAEEFFGEQTVMNPSQEDVLVQPGSTSDVTIYLENLDKYLEIDLAVGDIVETLEGRYTDFKWWSA